MCYSCKLFSCIMAWRKHHTNLQPESEGHAVVGRALQLWSSIYPQASAYEAALVQVSLPALHCDSRIDSQKIFLSTKTLLSGPGFHPACPGIPRMLQLWPQSSPHCMVGGGYIEWRACHAGLVSNVWLFLKVQSRHPQPLKSSDMSQRRFSNISESVNHETGQHHWYYVHVFSDIAF